MNLTKNSKLLKILIVLFVIVLIFSYTFFDDQKVVELTDELQKELDDLKQELLD